MPVDLCNAAVTVQPHKTRARFFDRFRVFVYIEDILLIYAKTAEQLIELLLLKQKLLATTGIKC